MQDDLKSRRAFLKQCVMGGCAAALAGYTISDLAAGGEAGLQIGFRRDLPKKFPRHAREAMWYDAGSRVHCTLCPHRCILAEGDRGFCRTRAAHAGKLYTLAYGNPCAVHVDPVEKKPLNHFLPGTPILSLATGGCNLRCLNCQNWDISQAKPEAAEVYDLPPAHVLAKALKDEIPSLAYTYSEPLMFYEYVYDTAVLAKEQNVHNVLVTAGYILPDPLRKLCTVIDAANVDIKAFDDEVYAKLCRAKLAPVLRTLEIMRSAGVWLEITYLIVPQYSDRLSEIRRMCRWLVENLGPDVPLHFSRFHPAYKLTLLPPTPLPLLHQARVAALEAGLRYVYLGNVAGEEAKTICPACKGAVIKRNGYMITENNLAEGRCPCGAAIAGVWS